MQKQYILVDGSGYIFRAFYALPPISRSDGLPVGAVYGFCNMLFKLLTNVNSNSKIVVVFDKKRQNFRNEIYPDYKANRTETPPDLIPQFEYIRKATSAFNLCMTEQEGFEADDIIATYSNNAKLNNDSVIIYSSDKDLMQLFNETTKIFDPLKNKNITNEDIINKFGVSPNLIPDVQALIGDTTDNIPGVKGIGIKTASELINKYGSLENLLLSARNIKQDKKRELILNGTDNAIISKKLATLKIDVPLDLPLENITEINIDKNKLTEFLTEMEFKSLIPKIDNLIKNINNTNNNEVQSDSITEINTTKQQAKIEIKDKINYNIINTETDLKNLINLLNNQNKISIKFITNIRDSYDSDITGIGIGIENSNSFYIPISHTKKIFAGDSLLDTTTKIIENQLPLNIVIKNLSPIINNPNIKKIGHNIKYDLHILKNLNTEINNIEDISLIAYLLNINNVNILNDLILNYFEKDIPDYDNLLKPGKNKPNLNDIDMNLVSNLTCQITDYIMRLYNILLPQLSDNLKKLYYDMDLKLIPCICNMEHTGISIDTNKLKTLSNEFQEILNTTTKEIYNITGTEFNISSPKQLGEILFNKLNISYPNKNSKTLSTDTEILHQLKNQGYSIADLLLKYREISKLKSTYTDSLITEISPKTGRVHTTYLTTSTSTGRFTSNNPNLQNIPIRSDYGKKIRETFISKENYSILSADYSQIELRIMAILSNCKNLQNAFLKNTDIHKQTASQIFNIPENEITPDLRRNAKAINFGIIYGMSAFGLAKSLNISNNESKLYIENYFKTFPEIKEYMEKTKNFARNNGYVETLFKRHINIPDINNPKLKSYAERMAINAPCQGTAADIIKIAMIKINEEITKNNLNNKIKMLLQVHDELVFEIDNNEIKIAKQIIKSNMENIIDTKIPIITEIGIGNNWNSAH